MHRPLSHGRPARSFLFVPGDKPARFSKALGSGAHAVIIDLEDAVSPAAKDGAREAARAFFAQGGTALLRVNSLDSPWVRDDLALCREAGVAGVVLPKADTKSCITEVRRQVRANLPIFPLIESATGMLNARDLAAQPAVARLLFGTVDFCLDLAMEGDGEELASHRAWLVLVSRAARLQPPVDGVTVSLHDAAGLSASALAAKRLGFGGKMCIHPAQVAVVNQCFQPSATQLAWATQVLALAPLSAGAFQFEGKMVDAPVLARAREWLESQSQ